MATKLFAIEGKWFMGRVMPHDLLDRVRACRKDFAMYGDYFGIEFDRPADERR